MIDEPLGRTVFGPSPFCFGGDLQPFVQQRSKNVCIRKVVEGPIGAAPLGVAPLLIAPLLCGSNQCRGVFGVAVDVAGLADERPTGCYVVAIASAMETGIPNSWVCPEVCI